MEFRTDARLTPAQLADVLRRSGLAERRPVEDSECLAGMVKGADLTVTAWEDGALIGVARSVTDFVYCCYLSELAVDRAFQGRGIGRALISHTQARLGPRCSIILLAAPAAVEYYSHIGMEEHPSAWILRPGAAVR